MSEETGVDTIDLVEEIEEFDTFLEEEIGVSASPPASRERASAAQLVELALLTIANSIWAILGLVLWLPQAIRAVLGAALRTVHSALTHQPSSRAGAGIRRVSELYAGRFLTREAAAPAVGRRQELRPFRLAGEVVWIAGFYLAVLKLIDSPWFGRLWEPLVALAEAAKLSLSGWARAGLDGAGSLLERWSLSPVEGVLAGGALLLALLLGFALGRR